MKIIANRLYITLIYLLGIFIAFAKPRPPEPNYKVPPAPPGAPIDDNILFLLLIAVLFGIYIIYKQNIKTKTPT